MSDQQVSSNNRNQSRSTLRNSANAAKTFFCGIKEGTSFEIGVWLVRIVVTLIVLGISYAGYYNFIKKPTIDSWETLKSTPSRIISIITPDCWHFVMCRLNEETKIIVQVAKKEPVIEKKI